jgi:hypothetical protein
MCSDASTIDLTVQSGTIVIGVKRITTSDVMAQNSNNQGLCEYTGEIVDSAGRSSGAGQLRITYSYEAHIHDTEVNSDSDDSSVEDNPAGLSALYNTTLQNSTTSTVRGTAKSIGHIHIVSVQMSDLNSVHTVSPNSPYCKIKCDDYRAVTTVSTNNNYVLDLWFHSLHHL